MRTLLLDNYDSFTWNLHHLLEPHATVDVVRNDAITVDEAARYDRIVLSPGPAKTRLDATVWSAPSWLEPSIISRQTAIVPARPWPMAQCMTTPSPASNRSTIILRNGIVAAADSARKLRIGNHRARPG